MTPDLTTQPTCCAAEEPAESFRLDGRIPERVFEPRSVEECAEVVRWAASAGSALVPWGGGAHIACGNPLRAPRWAALSTGALNRVLDYSPEDLVVTAQSGLSLAQAQAELATHGQMLALDAPSPELATLGGITAANTQGLWRASYGLPRDRLLGARLVLPDGSVVKGGGRVVKNVAGYDVCKLFAGSWGTLGLIIEVTYKVNPLPEARAHLCFAAPSLEAAVRAGLRVHEAQMEPLYAVAVSDPASMLCIGLLGNARTVAWQDKEITRLLGQAGVVRAEEGPSEEDLRAMTAGSAGPVGARIMARPSDLPALAGRLGPLATRISLRIRSGIATVVCTTEAGPGETAGRITDALPPGARLVWTRLPVEWKAEIDTWGPARPDQALTRAIKSQTDPRGVFSPGRFVGRI